MEKDEIENDEVEEDEELDENPKVNAIAKFLEVKPSEITEKDAKHYLLGEREYLVLTEDEANDEAFEYIEGEVEGFNGDFIEGETGITSIGDLIDIAREAPSRRGLDLHECVKSIIEKTCGMQQFVDDAINADGRGHFLSNEDGNENEMQFDGTTYYIYRLD